MCRISSPVPFVIIAVYLIAQITILHIGIEVNSIQYFIIYLSVDVAIRFPSDITIIFMVRIQFTQIILYPYYLTVMGVFVIIQATADGCIQFVPFIIEREYSTTETAVYQFTAYKV